MCTDGRLPTSRGMTWSPPEKPSACAHSGRFDDAFFGAPSLHQLDVAIVEYHRPCCGIAHDVFTDLGQHTPATRSSNCWRNSRSLVTVFVCMAISSSDLSAST